LTNTQKAKSTAEGPRLYVTFLKSAPTLDDCPPADQPEIAFAGRSNSGKSSVLNRLTGSRLTAKVSKTPGRTQVLNVFDVREGGRLVDLPGYGYAKASKSAQAAWQRNVNEYLSERDSLVGVVLVMDIRHPLTEYDLELGSWADQSELPLLILLNKADKLKQGQRQKILSTVQKTLKDQALTRVQLFSAQSGLGSAELVAQITDLLQQPFEADPASEPS
jgi:GTP-binding protein